MTRLYRFTVFLIVALAVGGFILLPKAQLKDHVKFLPFPAETAANRTAGSPSTQSDPQPEQGPIAESALKQIEALLADADARTPVQQKIDSQLLYENKQRRGQEAAPGVARLETSVKVDAKGKTTVDITTAGTVTRELTDNSKPSEPTSSTRCRLTGASRPTCRWTNWKQSPPCRRCCLFSPSRRLSSTGSTGRPSWLIQA